MQVTQHAALQADELGSTPGGDLGGSDQSVNEQTCKSLITLRIHDHIEQKIDFYLPVRPFTPNLVGRGPRHTIRVHHQGERHRVFRSTPPTPSRLCRSASGEFFLQEVAAEVPGFSLTVL